MNSYLTNRRGARPRAFMVLAVVAVGAGLAAAACAADSVPANSLRQDFADPPAMWKSRPLWFWNGPLDQGTTAQIMERSVASGYYGFGILPTKEMGVPFMSPAFPNHFGKTVDSAFYDEPTFHWVQGGRVGTPAFNERFTEKYGCSPALDYPALWHDIGPDTAAARNRMFGLRAELFGRVS